MPAQLTAVDILGVRIHNVRMRETLEALQSFVSDRRPCIVVTPNVDFVMQAQEDADLRRILNNADLAVPDGMLLIYGSWVRGTPLRGTVGGRYVIPAFCEIAKSEGYRIFLLGSDASTVVEAQRRLVTKYPGLQIVGTHPGFFEVGEEETIAEAILAARPDVVFVGLGCPHQERWMDRWSKRLQVPVMMGVGSAIDREGGKFRPPPDWMTHVGLEWAFRLAQDPRRLWRRYFVRDIRFIPLIVADGLRALGRRLQTRN